MSTHSVVLAIVRFFNAHGVPSYIYSDNARSFAAGCNFIQQVHVADEFEKNFTTFNIEHLTIPQFSAWFGRVWKRFVKTVKCCLYKLVGKQKLCYFAQLSVLSDIQNVVKYRPLTYRFSGDAGLDIISPNAFICPKNSSVVFICSGKSFFEGAPPSRCDLL